MKQKQIAALWLAFIGGLFLIALFGTLWFKQVYVGWLLESVTDSNEFVTQWQAALDENESIQHPAVIHHLQDDCLCRVLTLKHASQITLDAMETGYSVYQLNTATVGLGNSIHLKSALEDVVSPLIIITNQTGRIAYIGAYSDGIRCNTGTSMVESFISSIQNLPVRPVVGLDVESCRCEGAK